MAAFKVSLINRCILPSHPWSKSNLEEAMGCQQSYLGFSGTLRKTTCFMILDFGGGPQAHPRCLSWLHCDHHALLFQAQLRAFIPEMLKYSTGRGKPGWGKESCKPIWWPEDIPWANVRSDVRTEEQKQRVSSSKLPVALPFWISCLNSCHFCQVCTSYPALREERLI